VEKGDQKRPEENRSPFRGGGRGPQHPVMGENTAEKLGQKTNNDKRKPKKVDPGYGQDFRKGKRKKKAVVGGAREKRQGLGGYGQKITLSRKKMGKMGTHGL